MRYWAVLTVALIAVSGLIREPLTAVYFESGLDTPPPCSDKFLVDKVLSAVREYQRQNPGTNILERRRQKLMLKNLNSFIPVSTENFTSKDDLLTANKLITLKINQGFEDADITLCKSVGSGAEYNIYLMIYPADEVGRYHVEIINFLPPSAAGKDFSVLY